MCCRVCLRCPFLVSTWLWDLLCITLFSSSLSSGNHQITEMLFSTHISSTNSTAFIFKMSWSYSHHQASSSPSYRCLLPSLESFSLSFSWMWCSKPTGTTHSPAVSRTFITLYSSTKQHHIHLRVMDHLHCHQHSSCKSPWYWIPLQGLKHHTTRHSCTRCGTWPSHLNLHFSTESQPRWSCICASPLTFPRCNDCRAVDSHHLI